MKKSNIAICNEFCNSMNRNNSNENDNWKSSIVYIQKNQKCARRKLLFWMSEKSVQVRHIDDKFEENRRTKHEIH